MTQPSPSPQALSLSLSARGLAKLPASIYTNDFTFIVGGRKYQCPSVVADFLSPRLCRLRQSDSSIDEYELNIDDCSGDFSNFLSLGRGATFPISPSSLVFYLKVCENLENDELLRALLMDDLGLSVSTVTGRLLQLKATNGDCEREIEFTASHFAEMSDSDIALIGSDICLLSAIVSNGSLIIQDEDWLVCLLSGFSQVQPAYFSLFGDVRFEYVSESVIGDFIKLITKSFDYFSFSIWERLCDRLLLSVKPRLPNPRATSAVLRRVTPRSGIIRWLTDRCGRNVCDAGLISITAAHTNANLYGRDLNGGDAKTIFDLDTQLGWYDSNRDPSWLTIDFQEWRIHVTSYSITFGHDTCKSSEYPAQWILEGSNDQKTWAMIDDRSSEQSNRLAFATARFDCNASCSDGFRYLRLAKRGLFWGGNYYLGLSALEFFGRLREMTTGSQT
jgi:hypothetical protein